MGGPLDTIAFSKIDPLGILSIILGLVAIVQTYRANKFARKIAENEGAFEKPGLSISLFNDHAIEEIIWAIPFPEDGVVQVPLVYGIANNRSKSAIRNIELIIRMTNELHGGNSPDYDVNVIDSLKEVKSRFVDVTKYVHNFLMSIESLSPKQTMNYEDQVLFRGGTSAKSTITVKDKNDIPFEISFEVELAYAIDLILMADDIEPIRKQFRHKVVNTSKISLEDYFQKWTQNAQKQMGYNKMNLLKRIYLYNKHLNEKNRNFILVCCESPNLERIGEEPLYSLTKFHTTYGTEFINGYAIPAKGIYPKPIQRIFGFEFFLPWL